MEPELQLGQVSGASRTEPDRAGYTLTIEEASELFAEAGVPRNPRSVRRFCQIGALDCITMETPTGSRYMIGRSSVDKLITEKLQALRFGQVRSTPVIAGQDRTEPDMSGHNRPAQDVPNLAQASPQDTAEIKRLEDEVVNLRIDNRAKEQVITMLRDERRELLTQVESASYRLGAAETRLGQLEAPKPHAAEETHGSGSEPVSHVEAVIMQAPIDVTPSPALKNDPAPEPRRSLFGRLFR